METLALIESIKLMVGFMRDKEQKIKYINGRWCDVINDVYLSAGWHVVSIHPVSDRNEIGAYVILEKQKPILPNEYPIE